MHGARAMHQRQRGLTGWRALHAPKSSAPDPNSAGLRPPPAARSEALGAAGSSCASLVRLDRAAKAIKTEPVANSPPALHEGVV